jgi:hypothetical protein
MQKSLLKSVTFLYSWSKIFKQSGAPLPVALLLMVKNLQQFVKQLKSSISTMLAGTTSLQHFTKFSDTEKQSLKTVPCQLV